MNEDSNQIQATPPPVVLPAVPDFSPVDFDSIGLQGQANEISVAKIAQEMLTYLDVHVEDYLDNRNTAYRLYFPQTELGELPEMQRLFDLYKLIPVLPQNHPQEEQTVTALKYLHSVTAKVKDEMNQNRILRQKLFDRLIIYYDTKIRKIKGKDVMIPITYDLEGYVHIHLFDYEAFSQSVKVIRGTATGDQPIQGAETIKNITLPEGYVVEFILHFWPKTMTTSFGL